MISDSMRLWLDSKTPAPPGYFWAKNIDEAKKFVVDFEEEKENMLDEWDFPPIEIWNLTVEICVNCDSNDSIEFLEWLEETKRNYPIRINGASAAKKNRLREIVIRNCWKKIE